MTIREIEARCQMERANIRFYEREGLLTAQRLPNGYRDYIDTLRDWDSRGLIDKDFGSKTMVLGAITDEWKLGQYVVSWDCFVYLDRMNANAC